jgi:hypothetical protein
MPTRVAAATYRELFGRSGPNLPLSLSRMPAANREHLRDRRVLPARKRHCSWRRQGFHPIIR